MSHARQSVRHQHRIAFRLPASQLARLRKIAGAREARISELVRDALVEKLDRLERRKRESAR